MRAHFSPITGNRRTGLVALNAVRERPGGQVRTGDVTHHADFAALVESIREHGILQPIRLTWDEVEDCFWIDYGHRRVQAARAAGLSQVPAVIVVLDGNDENVEPGPTMTQQQLIENLQRTELPTLDVAFALKRLVDGGMPAASVSRGIGKSRSWVSKHIRLLSLPESLLSRAESESLGHELLYTVAQADVEPHEREALFDIALKEGRPGLMRFLESRSVAQAALRTQTPTDPPPSTHDGTASQSPPIDPPEPASRRALLGATLRCYRSSAHLVSLLDLNPDADEVGLANAARSFVAALERFRKQG